MSTSFSRRRWLEIGASLVAGGGLEAAFMSLRKDTSMPVRHRAAKAAANVRPTLAVSLAELQRRIEDRRVRDRDAANLGGMTAISGFTRDGEDTILFGLNEEGDSAMHADDLAVALQSAYRFRLRPDGAWEPIGVSIDPRVNE